MVRMYRALIVVAAIALASGCSIKKSERPTLTGPSEMGLSLNITANPDTLTQDGFSQARVVVLALDGNGQPIRGLPLHVEASAKTQVASLGQLSATDVATGSDGRATIGYTAPPLPPDSSDPGTTIVIYVTPTGTDYAGAVSRSVNIRLVPPSVVTPGPVATFGWAPLAIVPGSPVTFDGSRSQPSQGATLVSWVWDFGDGTTGSGMRPQHVYGSTGSYTVGLTVVDNTGRASYTIRQTITVSDPQPVTADFVFSPSQPAVGQTIFFDASTSKPGSGRTIVDYVWNFGNGSSARGLTATTTYGAAGTYNVTLVVTDDLGQTGSNKVQVTVK